MTIVGLTTSGCVHNDSWTKQDTALQIGVTTALLADAATTSRIQDSPYAYENGLLAGAVLGRQPSTSDTYIYFGTLALSNYLIARALPEKWRPYWQSGHIAMHGIAINQNCNADLC